MLAAMTETRARYDNSRARRRSSRPCAGSGEAAGFPGCEAVRMNAEQLAGFERHIEYWDEQSGVAWVCETTVEHERPGFRLAVLAHRIGQARGAPIVSYGTTRLEDHRRTGQRQVMEPDQAVFLDAARAAALRSPVLVEAGDGPDVALEVDHTTDVRRRKLAVYEAWRVPEVWMEVPNESTRRRPGLTIYALDACSGRYREAGVSEVLLGWTAGEIHQALNEPAISAATWATVLRVGRAMGERDGTKPTDDPLHGPLLRQAQRQATQQATRQAVERIFARRGIAYAPSRFADGSLLAAHSADALVDAALACDSEADFLAALAAAPESQPKRGPA